MNQESVREFCLSLPYAIERVQWGSDLLFCVGNKMFAVLALDAGSPYRLTFKCTPEVFAELTELDGIDPAPYVARYHWAALKRFDAVNANELQRLLRASYQMVLERLPGKVKRSLAKPGAARKATRVKKKSRKR